MSAESLTLTCPKCEARMRVPGAAAGRRVRCPKCQEAFRAEAPPIDAPADGELDLFESLSAGEAVESPEAQRARLQAAAAARVAPALAPEPEVSTRSTAAKGRGGGGLGPFIVGFFSIFGTRSPAGYIAGAGLIGGAILFYMGLREFRLREHTSDEPTPITCEHLVTTGPGENRHIILTDFVMLPSYVYETRRGRWTGAWVPVISMEIMERTVAAQLRIDPGELKNVSDDQRADALSKLAGAEFPFKLILHLPSARGEADVDATYDLDELQGTLLVEDFFTGLSFRQRTLLEQSYPKADLKNCMKLTVGRAPYSAMAALGLTVGGGVGVLVALVLAFQNGMARMAES